ncbi:MAG: hypothetical protein QOE58_2144 [Actinomycetota bacterium]|jgi:hypothetical protein|nr:hypothetical protein [Actinomycetota bacterium]
METPLHGPLLVCVVDELESIDRLKPLDTYRGQGLDLRIAAL